MFKFNFRFERKVTPTTASDYLYDLSNELVAVIAFGRTASGLISSSFFIYITVYLTKHVGSKYNIQLF